MTPRSLSACSSRWRQETPGPRPAAFRAFFADPQVRLLPVARTTWERAARIGAANNFKPMDSLHLATAVEHGCGMFLTADGQLGRCTDIPVEVLK